MANQKHKNTKEELLKQRIRTHKNLIKKYNKLILNNPEHKDVKIWQKKIEEINNSSN